MRSFPDTSFLCSFYRTQEHSPKVDAFMDGHPEALQVSSLLLLEFRQSVRLQIRLHGQDSTKGFSRHEGHAMLRDLQSDLHRKILSVVRWIGWKCINWRRCSARNSQRHRATGSRIYCTLPQRFPWERRSFSPSTPNKKHLPWPKA